jgi:ribosomal protein L13
MKTYMAKPGEVDKNWVLIDAEGQVFGRLASKVATILNGKNKPEYTPHVDVGDHVVIINAERLCLPGTNWTRNFITGTQVIRAASKRRAIKTLWIKGRSLRCMRL